MLSELAKHHVALHISFSFYFFKLGVVNNLVIAIYSLQVVAIIKILVMMHHLMAI